MTIRAQQPARDPRREREFLQRASAFTGARLFIAHCEHRLGQGDREFGQRWARIGLHQHVRELSEEGADLGAWAALAEQAVDLEHVHDSRLVRVQLSLAARGGAIAHQAVEQLARLLSAEISGAVA